MDVKITTFVESQLRSIHTCSASVLGTSEGPSWNVLPAPDLPWLNAKAWPPPESQYCGYYSIDFDCSLAALDWAEHLPSTGC
jgi:hypothetical protein